jgi:sulfoxide reductase heme-binding subunit YedZ
MVRRAEEKHADGCSRHRGNRGLYFVLSLLAGHRLGPGSAQRLGVDRLRHSTVYGIHHTVALLGLCLALVHALAQLAAPQGPVRLVDEVLPFLNPVDPLGIGVGVVGLEILLAAACRP